MQSTATLIAPPGRATRRQPRRGLVLGIILAVQLMVVLDATIVNIALPDIAGALHFSPANLSWVITAYTLAFGGFLLLGARAGDLLGRRRVFIAGIALFTAASFLGGIAPWSGWLLAARALQGIGGALAAPSALALPDDHVPGRTGARPRDRLVHGRVHRRRRHRPHPRRPAHPVGVLALGALRQRADRPRRHRARPPAAHRDAQPQRSLRRARCADIDDRRHLAGVRVRARRNLGMGRHAHRGRVRGRHSSCWRRSCCSSGARPSRSRRCGSSPTAAAARRTSRGCSSPRGCSGCSSSSPSSCRRCCTTAR